MAMVSIDKERCKGCGLCVRACPKGLLILSKEALNSKGYETAVIEDQGSCIACASCAHTCPDVCISIEK